MDRSEMNFVYEFTYCWCIYESGFTTVSIHRTAAGAYWAMRNFRMDMFNKWRNKPGKQEYLDTVHQAWRIRKREVLE